MSEAESKQRVVHDKNGGGMELTYQFFPIRDAVHHELSRFHYVRLTKVETAQAGQKQLFASRYLPYLPTEAELQHQLVRERALLQAKQEEQL